MQLTTPSIQHSNHLMIIKLKSAQLEDVIHEKLLYVLNQKEAHFSLLDDFYNPVEKAIIEEALDFFKGNQLKTALALKINRSTLKKKINLYTIDLKSLLNKAPSFNSYRKEIFATSLPYLHLFELSRHKIKILSDEKDFFNLDPIQKICDPIEKKIVLTCLKFFKGNQLKTAKALGINRNTLKKKLDQFNH